MQSTGDFARRSSTVEAGFRGFEVEKGTARPLLSKISALIFKKLQFNCIMWTGAEFRHPSYKRNQKRHQRSARGRLFALQGTLGLIITRTRLTSPSKAFIHLEPAARGSSRDCKCQDWGTEQVQSDGLVSELSAFLDVNFYTFQYSK